MPRRPRLHIDQVPSHSVQRGHIRPACFFGDDDYRSYLRWLAEVLKEADCRFHAEIAALTGEIRQARPRGRPRKSEGGGSLKGAQQALALD